MKENLRFRVNKAVRITGLAASLLIGMNGCSKEQTDATAVKVVEHKSINMTYLEPGQSALINSVNSYQRVQFESIPTISTSKGFDGAKEAAPDKVKLGIDRPVRLSAEFSSDASEGSGDTPDLACISLQLPKETKYLGVAADGDAQDDFAYFEPLSDGNESKYGAHICFDARSSENVGTIAVVASTEQELR